MMRDLFKSISYRQKLASTCKRCVFFLLALTILVLTSCSNEKPSPKLETPPTAVRVASVSRQSLFQKNSYVGTVHSRQEVKVIAQIPGTVTWLAPEGSTMLTGQALAKLAAQETTARVSRLDAEVQRAMTERDFLCKTFDTDQRLGAAGVVPDAKVDMSRRACESAKAALDATRASAVEIGVGAKKTSETAPFEGRVLQWLVEPGQNVMPGTPLLLLGSHDLELRVPVAERDISKGVRAKTPALVQLGETQIRLFVDEVAPLATGAGRSVDVRIHLPNDSPLTLSHGMSARVDLILAESIDTLAIPQKALWQSNEKYSVFVIDDEQAHQVSVVPGIRDGDWISVEGELSEGKRLAVSNLDVLKEGTKVYPVEGRTPNEVQP